MLPPRDSTEGDGVELGVEVLPRCGVLCSTVGVARFELLLSSVLMIVLPVSSTFCKFGVEISRVADWGMSGAFDVQSASSSFCSCMVGVLVVFVKGSGGPFAT